MPSPAKPPPDAGAPENRVELGKLIEGALARHGASARAIAARAGIGASHLSKVLKAQRSLRRAKLLILSDLLGLDREKVLRLAGFGRTEHAPIELGKVTLLRAQEKFTLNVVVTPRFYDAAVFMWMTSQNPFSPLGVETQVRRVDWASVPAELASYTYSVGFHSQSPAIFRLARWSHLCLDKGHALFGRDSSGQGAAGLAALSAQARKSGKRLSMLAIDSAVADLARNAEVVGDEIDVHIVPNPDVALESFRAGAGDIFLAALPQRMALRKAGFRELLVCGGECPGLYAFNGLICSERMLTEKKAVLQGIDALWYETCERLYTDAAFRAQVFQEIGDLLERHGVEKHSLVKHDFDVLFSEAGREFSVFARRPAELLEEHEKLRQM